MGNASGANEPSQHIGAPAQEPWRSAQRFIPARTPSGQPLVPAKLKETGAANTISLHVTASARLAEANQRVVLGVRSPSGSSKVRRLSPVKGSSMSRNNSKVQCHGDVAHGGQAVHDAAAQGISTAAVHARRTSESEDRCATQDSNCRGPQQSSEPQAKDGIQCTEAQETDSCSPKDRVSRIISYYHGMPWPALKYL